jgi:glycosyltransferase involved in cell wall biosynthesis
LFSGFLRFKGLKVFITEPTGMAAAGFLSKFLFRTFWVLDLWDRPQWRPGQHESGKRRKLFDRTVFWVMRHADLFLLSCMKHAVRDINPPEDRCAHFYNALDPKEFSDSIPERKPGEALRLSFGKSIFDDTVGLSVVVEAAEILVDKECNFEFHIVGDLASEAAIDLVNISPAVNNIVLHGVTRESRSEFFKMMHAGLVPYMDFEDLKYIYPIKVLEHLSQGNPVIASDLPGLAAMVQDGYNGYLVKPNDPVSLAEAVLKLESNPVLWKEMAENALQSIRKFDAYKKNKKIFETIINRTT